mmetsp:Transcript_57518/g.160125  ORF Transcript_57518/g.160125 Transcript_57518/m.160125 type:complete len:338 (-) Transcript_57518:715-1728(-)
MHPAVGPVREPHWRWRPVNGRVLLGGAPWKRRRRSLIRLGAGGIFGDSSGRRRARREGAVIETEPRSADLRHLPRHRAAIVRGVLPAVREPPRPGRHIRRRGQRLCARSLARDIRSCFRWRFGLLRSRRAKLNISGSTRHAAGCECTAGGSRRRIGGRVRIRRRPRWARLERHLERGPVDRPTREHPCQRQAERGLVPIPGSGTTFKRHFEFVDVYSVSLRDLLLQEALLQVRPRASAPEDRVQLIVEACRLHPILRPGLVDAFGVLRLRRFVRNLNEQLQAGERQRVGVQAEPVFVGNLRIREHVLVAEEELLPARHGPIPAIAADIPGLPLSLAP